MVTVQEVDVSELGFLLDGIRNALIGTGRDGDLSKLTRDEARLLAVEIGNQVSPRTLAAGEKKVESTVEHFLWSPRFENLEGGKREGDGITWIQASSRALVGVNDEDYFGQTSNSGFIKWLFHREQEQGVVGNVREFLGKRGEQHVQLINRSTISKKSKARLIDELKAHVGRMKASFLETAMKLGHAHVPGWISRHFPNPKSITDESGMANAESPSITFGSKARGVQKMQDRVKRSARNRAAKMHKKLKGILYGYAQDAHSGNRPRRHFKPENN